jgi:hypothetical protein
MPALWPTFENTVSQFLTKGTLSQDQFIKMIAGAYTVATTPITVNYSTGPVPQPVLNGIVRQKILRDAMEKVLNASKVATDTLTVKDFIPAALGFIKYWTPGIGVLISPLPAPPPCVAPVIAGTFLSDDEFKSALPDDAAPLLAALGTTDGDTKSLYSRIVSQAVVNDPVVILPSPIVLFPGNPLLLAKDLHFAMTKSFSPQATATNLTKAFSNHLSTIIGIYIGLLPPGSVPPFTIVVFNGIT